MIFHLLFVPFLVVLVIFAALVRLITAPFRRRHPRNSWYAQRYGRGYGYGRPYGGGSLLTMLALVALERIFDRRY